MDYMTIASKAPRAVMRGFRLRAFIPVRLPAALRRAQHQVRQRWPVLDTGYGKVACELEWARQCADELERMLRCS